MSRKRTAITLGIALGIVALVAIDMSPLLPWTAPTWTTPRGVTLQWRHDVRGAGTRMLFANDVLYATLNGISALDPATGRVLWQAFVPNTRDFVVVEDTIFTTGVFAIDAATGRIRWRVNPGEGSIVVAEEGDARRVYIACGDGGACALDGRTGDRLWHADVGTRIDAMAAANGLVYAAGIEGHVVALDADTGQERWRANPAGPPKTKPDTDLGSNIAIPWLTATQDRVFVVIHGGRVVALDAETGEEQWLWNMRKRPPPVARTWFPGPPPVVDDGIVYVATEYDDLFALEADTGREVWRLEVVWEPVPRPDGVPESAVPVALDFTDGTTGNRRWRAEVGRIQQSPRFVRDGFLVSTCPDVSSKALANCAIFVLDLATGERRWEVGVDGIGNANHMAVTTEAVYGATGWTKFDRSLFFTKQGGSIFALALPSES